MSSQRTSDVSPAAETRYRAACGACGDCDVRTMAVCAALEPNEIGALERIMTSRRIGADETLVEEGERRRRVYSLTSGMLRLVIGLPDGRRQITGFLLPGDYLGLADEDVYSATAEAVVPSSLCAFPVTEMDLLVARYPKLNERLFGFTRAALRHARENQMILGRLAPVEKLATFLLMLSQRAVEHRMAANPIAIAMSRSDIADYLGLTIETVSRSFTKLRSQGLIDLPDAHLVEIRDRKALEAVAGTMRA